MDTRKYLTLFLVAFLLSATTVCGQEESGQERTLGLFRNRNRYHGGGGGFGNFLGGLFGGPSFNPYFSPGFGYGGGFNPYLGGPPGPPGPFFGPGFGPGGYAPGFGGYRQFPGGYSGGSIKNKRFSRELDVNKS